MHLYGLIIGLSLILLISKLPIKTTGFTVGFLLSLLIGARAYHVADYWWYYSAHPSEILFTWNGGLGIFGALIAGLLFLFFYSLLNHKSYILLLDSISPVLPLVQSIGRLGNFFNREISVWWLESLWCFFLFLLIKKFPRHPTAKYLIGYGLIRFLDEFFRTDTWLIGSIKVGQVISLSFIIAGILLLAKLQKRGK